ncbi:MAG: 3-oxoacyl-ACP reductase FabG [Lachnospiraceae bacterium]|nr:3-oxoacyl-ACP reductase FabG [Lachnospiraceae bacterium]
MLKGKVALVTGASRGIGKETAIKLGKQGAVVIVNYKSNKALAAEVVTTIIAAGGKAEAYGCDVSDYSAVKEMFAHIVETYGTIDILVNNAGVTLDKKIEDITEEDYANVMGTNLKGTFNCIQCASKYMIGQESGRIINITSVITSLLGNVGQSCYAASKSGVIGLTKALAEELGPKGITVNAIAPGLIESQLTYDLEDSAKEKALEHISLKKVGQSQDIAELVAYIASKKASYITGQVISVDGGMQI